MNARLDTPASSELPRKHRVIVVSEHALARAGMVHGLNAQPDLEVVAEFDSCKDAVASVMKSPPEAIVFELTLGGGHTLDAIERCRKAAPDTALVVICESVDRAIADKVIRLGALGYLYRSAGLQALTRAIRAALQGELHVCPCIASALLSASMFGKRRPDGSDGRLSCLSPREFQVLQLLSAGRGNRAISDALGISLKTVSAHKENIKTKLSLKSASDLRDLACSWASRSRAEEERF